jgi:hypothetical protein
MLIFDRCDPLQVQIPIHNLWISIGFVITPAVFDRLPVGMYSPETATYLTTIY